MAGLQYLRARWYDAGVGRFNRLDPFVGRTGDPLTLHKYAYCHANPVMGVDPSGESMVGWLAGSISVRSIISGMYAASVATAYTSIVLTGLVQAYSIAHIYPLEGALTDLALEVAQSDAPVSVSTALLAAAKFAADKYWSITTGNAKAVGLTFLLAPFRILKLLRTAYTVGKVSFSVYHAIDAVTGTIGALNHALKAVGVHMEVRWNKMNTISFAAQFGSRLATFSIHPVSYVKAVTEIVRAKRTGRHWHALKLAAALAIRLKVDFDGLASVVGLQEPTEVPQ